MGRRAWGAEATPPRRPLPPAGFCPPAGSGRLLFSPPSVVRLTHVACITFTVSIVFSSSGATAATASGRRSELPPEGSVEKDGKERLPPPPRPRLLKAPVRKGDSSGGGCGRARRHMRSSLSCAVRCGVVWGRKEGVARWAPGQT